MRKFVVFVILVSILLILVNSEERHPCFRKCSEDPATRRICHYDFTLEHFWMLSKACYGCPNSTEDCFRLECIPGDGVARAVTVVNRKLPGPGIRVCQGDTIIVDVHNHLVAEQTTIHWHGVQMKQTPWMDGVPGLTQCPIQSGEIFRYEFDVPKAGTFFWHSHVGFQRGDGVFGPLIVRKPERIDPAAHPYDHDLPEHELLLMDWTPDISLNKFLKHHHSDGDNKPPNILINGRGLPAKFYRRIPENVTLQDSRIPFVPLHEIRVKHGEAYRLRIISNGVLNCPLEISIKGHSLLVISADAVEVEPVAIGSFVIYSGERFDVVLKANQTPDSYWIKVRGLEDCDDRFTMAYQVAVLNYDTLPSGTLPQHSIRTWSEAAASMDVGIQLNPLNMAPAKPGYMLLHDLRSLEDDDPEIIEQENSDYKFYLSYDFNPIDNVHFHGSQAPFQSVRQSYKLYTPQINFISNVMPASPMLTQPEALNSVNTCNETSMKVDCTKVYCECTHLLKVKLNSTVEIVFIDRGLVYVGSHPFHLHGQEFRVLAMERLGDSTEDSIVKSMDEQGKIVRNRYRAPIKDTVVVPDGGYTVIRFRANNPGFWFLHCHLEYHMEIGMGVVIQVGETTEMLRAPLDFPKCGNYLPETKDFISIVPLTSERSPNPYYPAYTGPISAASTGPIKSRNSETILQSNVKLLLLSASLTFVDHYFKNFN